MQTNLPTDGRHKNIPPPNQRQRNKPSYITFWASQYGWPDTDRGLSWQRVRLVTA